MAAQKNAVHLLHCENDNPSRGIPADKEKVSAFSKINAQEELQIRQAVKLAMDRYDFTQVNIRCGEVVDLCLADVGLVPRYQKYRKRFLFLLQSQHAVRVKYYYGRVCLRKDGCTWDERRLAMLREHAKKHFGPYQLGNPDREKNLAARKATRSVEATED